MLGKLGAVFAVLVFLREIEGISESASARNNRDLMNGVERGEIVRDKCVARLVISCLALFLVLYLHTLLLSTDYDLHYSIFDIVHTDKSLAASCREKSRFVKKVSKVCACKACSSFCDYRKVNTLFKGFVSCVDLKNFLSALEVGIVYRNFTVKTSGTEKCGVETYSTETSNLCWSAHATGSRQWD